MKMKNFFLPLLLAAMISVPAHLGAQITIGSGNPPSEWSLLDLDNSERVGNNEQPKALHLPRLTTAERNALFNRYNPNPPAAGLMIFRTDAIYIGDDEYLGCLEFWNGAQWISVCESDYFVSIPPGEGCENFDISEHFDIRSAEFVNNPPAFITLGQSVQFQLVIDATPVITNADIEWFVNNTTLAHITDYGRLTARVRGGTVVVVAGIRVNGCWHQLASHTIRTR